jgi:predicted transcriptional regulator
MPLIPNTQTLSVFSYDVMANGNSIGNLQSFAPSSTRTLTRVRQIASSFAGETIEIIPSITDHQITISVLELYRQQTLEALGYTNFASIEDLRDSIDIKERINRPDGSVVVVDYQECWLNTFNKSGIAANGSVVTDNLTLWVTRIRIGS